jgi:hypothetical protein
MSENLKTVAEVLNTVPFGDAKPLARKIRVAQSYLSMMRRGHRPCSVKIGFKLSAALRGWDCRPQPDGRIMFKARKFDPDNCRVGDA